jgi:hypothetical protein
MGARHLIVICVNPKSEAVTVGGGRWIGEYLHVVSEPRVPGRRRPKGSICQVDLSDAMLVNGLPHAP